MSEADDGKKKGLLGRLFGGLKPSDDPGDLADYTTKEAPDGEAASAEDRAAEEFAEAEDTPDDEAPAVSRALTDAAADHAPAPPPSSADETFQAERPDAENFAEPAEDAPPGAAPETALPGHDEEPPPVEPATSGSAPSDPATTEITEPPVQPGPPGVPQGPEVPKKGWFSRLRDGLSKTSNKLGGSITGIFTQRKLDDAALEELEDALIQADLGVDMAMTVAQAVGKGRYNKEISPEEVRAVLAAEVAKVLEPVALPLEIDATKKPFVILVVGVNGSGKTTTIGKLANQFVREGKSVVLAAGDTFRAAAIEQLGIWGERSGAPVVARDLGADSGGLAFEAHERAVAAGADIMMMDTAGRLQNKAGLMAELEKIIRVLRKRDAEAPHAVLLVLDATVGQNALSQVKAFRDTAGVTGLVMTKLDGTARGGILVAVSKEFGLPVHAIGVGEGIDDLQPFEARAFARAIAGVET